MTASEMQPNKALDSRPDNIAIITYSSNMEVETGEVYPSALSRFVADVAIAGWSNTESKFVVAGERSFGADKPSTGEVLKLGLQKSGIASNRIKVINEHPNKGGIHLDNTALQVEALSHEYTGYPKPILALAMSYHIPRIIRYADAYNLDLQVVAADNLWGNLFALGQLNRGDLDRQSQVIKALPSFARREKPIEIFSRIDRKGKVINILTRRQGPRLHDVDPESGKAIITTTRIKTQEHKISNK